MSRGYIHRIYAGDHRLNLGLDEKKSVLETKQLLTIADVHQLTNSLWRSIQFV